MAKHLNFDVTPAVQAAYLPEQPSRTPVFELCCGPLHVTLDRAPLKLLTLGSTLTAVAMRTVHWLR